jgi:hypothetical protein
MMTDNLRDLLVRQKQSLDAFGQQLEREILRLESSGGFGEAVKETERLEAEIAALKKQLAEAGTNTVPEIRGDLRERLYSEKINLTDRSEQRMEAFFAEKPFVFPVTVSLTIRIIYRLFFN